MADFKAQLIDLMNDKKKCVLVICFLTAILAGICVVVAVLLSGKSGSKKSQNTLQTGSQSVLENDSAATDVSATESGSGTGASNIADGSEQTTTASGDGALTPGTSHAGATASGGSNNSNTSSGNKQYVGEIVFREPASGTTDINKLTFQIKSSMPGYAIPEATPSFLFVNGKGYLTVPTGHSITIPLKSGAKPMDIFKSLFSFDSANSWLSCDNQAQSGLRTMGKNAVSAAQLNDDSCWKPNYPYWKRMYYTSFGTTVAKVDGKEYIFSINHGENKNEKLMDGRKYANTIQAKRAYADNEYSGPRQTESGLVYDDYAPSYFAFTGLSVIPVSEFKQGMRFDSAKYDKGPIVWPTTGYLDVNGNRSNSGLRHPSIFIDNGYIYVYYLDNDMIRVARAPLSQKGEPGSFRAYANGNFNTLALPSGFTKESRSYFRKGIGDTAAILKGSRSLRFSVAKLKGTPYYIGVEEYFTSWPSVGCQLRLSKDLVNWSEPFKIPGSFNANYNNGTLHYPSFYNKDFTSNAEIDPSEFYIIGTSGNNVGRSQADVVKFSIEIN